VATDAPLARYARELDGKDLGDGRVLTVTVGEIDARTCELAYVHGATTPAAVRAAQASLLAVSDAPDALERGYAIQFFVDGGTVRFAAQQDVIARADYRVSSKLLKLARQLK
jgi:hypothetical protein